MGSVYPCALLGSSNASAAELPQLLERQRFALRAKRYTYRTEQAYVHWIRRYILYHGKRHQQEMGNAAIKAFLTHLCV